MLALSATGVVRAEVTVTRINYEGWEDSYRLSNGTVELVFVPQIGRIMRYSYIGGRNVLWENKALTGTLADPQQAAVEWPNFGGDKLWPAPQARWNWPPDPLLDSAPQAVQILPGQHLLIVGQSSPKSGIRFSREITMAATGTDVTLKNTMINTSDSPVNWSVWEVSQTNAPDVAHLALNKEGHFPTGYYTFKDSVPAPTALTLNDTEAALRRHPKKSCKIGSDSPKGYLAAEEGTVRFQTQAAYEPGQNYPDDGCAQEIWSNPDPLKYMELELLSPLQTIQPGSSYSFTTHWSLTRSQ